MMPKAHTYWTFCPMTKIIMPSKIDMRDTLFDMFGHLKSKDIAMCNLYFNKCVCAAGEVGLQIC